MVNVSANRSNAHVCYTNPLFPSICPYFQNNFSSKTTEAIWNYFCGTVALIGLHIQILYLSIISVTCQIRSNQTVPETLMGTLGKWNSAASSKEEVRTRAFNYSTMVENWRPITPPCLYIWIIVWTVLLSFETSMEPECKMDAMAIFVNYNIFYKFENAMTSCSEMSLMIVLFKGTGCTW